MKHSSFTEFYGPVTSGSAAQPSTPDFSSDNEVSFMCIKVIEFMEASDGVLFTAVIINFFPVRFRPKFPNTGNEKYQTSVSHGEPLHQGAL
jgi:hypothetical protein